ncbi:MAG: hypothetical protein GX142_00670 [Chloroflexi bacterium]|nr:hypothetical protein [Chloroflexota bacterium]
MRKFGNFIFGAFIGGLVGSMVALLFAPTTGEHARGEIQGYFKHLVDEINHAADEKRAELIAQLDALRAGK